MKRVTFLGRKKRSVKSMIAFGFILCFLLSLLFVPAKERKKNNIFSVVATVTELLSKTTLNTTLPIYEFAVAKESHSDFRELLLSKVWKQIPFLTYAIDHIPFLLTIESDSTYEMIILCEGQEEETDQEMDINSEYSSDYDMTMGGTLDENSQAREEQMLQENNLASSQIGNGGVFVKNTIKQKNYNMLEYKDFGNLMKEFYVVASTTSVTENRLNVETLLSKDMSIKGNNEKPQILIYHTHSQEAFANSTPGDPNTSIMAAGAKLAQVLTDEYGYNVIHHKGEYDVEVRDYAYSKAAPEIEAILKENPSIEVIIDLHRDGVKDNVRLVHEMNGKKYAMFMLFNGLSYNNKLGDITYLPNPNIENNLAFSFQTQINANEYYPGLTRRIYLSGYRYNMQYLPKNMLIELGAQTNTVEEIMNTIDPLAHVLSMTLSGQ